MRLPTMSVAYRRVRTVVAVAALRLRPLSAGHALAFKIFGMTFFEDDKTQPPSSTR